MLRKVRHENIVLFMGVCMNPPNLCIVTEYIKGKSLHFYIHERGKAYTERESMQIMEQVTACCTDTVKFEQCFLEILFAWDWFENEIYLKFY